MSADAVGSFEIAALTAGYREGRFTPRDVINAAYDRIAAWGDDATFISLLTREEALALAEALGTFDPGAPLWGIPCAVKDNIDAEGFDTSLACAQAAYVPSDDAPAVAGLRAAGAIVVGKTNLDQFATGLNGTRSPFGTPRNVFHDDLIPGGSSSGSAVAVAAGLVSFTLGTDTAGSGRVPAALGSIVGLKPSRGLISARGVYPACASLDCVSIFALTVDDATLVASCIAHEDRDDAFSRSMETPGPSVPFADLDGVRFAIPVGVEDEFFGSAGFEVAWAAVLAALGERGAVLEPIPMDLFYEAGALLYGGAWIAERYAALEPTLRSAASAVEPTVRAIVEPGAHISGAEVFDSIAHLERMRREVRSRLAAVDALLTPTIPGVFTTEQMLRDPIVNNARLGRFTTFTNLLDLAAVAVPASMTAGVPFGISLQAPARSDSRLGALAAAVADALAAPLGATGWTPVARDRPMLAAAHDADMNVAVVGAHLRGQPLHKDLLALGARLVAETSTAPEYKLFALAATSPPKPGLVRASPGGAVSVEVYSLRPAAVAALLATIQPPLALGPVRLADGSQCVGFVCTDPGDGEDITAFGGWREFLASR
jgi:allophanate hydrolase